MAFAEERLNDGELPSGMTLENLYAHLHTLGNDISKEKSRYTGWISFPILTKYNEGSELIGCLDPKDGNVKDGDTS